MAGSLLPAGRAGRFGATKAQCSSYLAPCSIQPLIFALSVAVSERWDFGGGITTLRTSVVDLPAVAARSTHASGAFLRALRTAFGEAFRRSHPDPAAPPLLPMTPRADGDVALQLWTAVVTAEAVGSETEAIDAVFGNLDGWLEMGEFSRVNEFFRIARPERLSTSTLLSVLTVTLPYRPRLAARDAFVGSVRAHLSATESTSRVASLLRGLA